jgi:hypothetical protein
MEEQQQYTSAFESQADFQFRLIDPDSKTLFADFKEQNKDLVTSNLDKREIVLIRYCDDLIDMLSLAGEFLQSVRTSYTREFMNISNTSKAKEGFYIKQFTEQRITKTERFSKNKPQEIGESR